MPLTNCIDNIIVSVGGSLASLGVDGGILLLHMIMMSYPCSYCPTDYHDENGLDDPEQFAVLSLPIVLFVTHNNVLFTRPDLLVAVVLWAPLAVPRELCQLHEY